MTADSAGSRRLPRRLAPIVVCVTLAGLPMLAAPVTSVLSSDIRDVIRDRYLSPERETRYLDAAIDLDADGQAEMIVHVVGGKACAGAGCPTLVFTHLASGYRLLSTIAGAAPPIRVSSHTSKGWSNLIVRLSSDGSEARDVELKFDGRSYPGNPAERSGLVKAAKSPGRLVIDAFAFERMKLFPAETR